MPTKYSAKELLSKIHIIDDFYFLEILERKERETNDAISTKIINEESGNSETH